MELVSVPFEVKPDLLRSAAPLGSGVISPELREHKRAEFLGPMGSDLFGQLPHCDEGLALLAKDLGTEEGRIDELALQCPEDLALLHHGVLQAIAFAFPSGFRPTQKLGQDFATVHAPVAEGDVLRAASRGISAAMVRPGAHFERGVWTLTSLASFSQHPDIPRPHLGSVNDLFFRTEFQVLKSLGQGWSAFSVKPSMTPWADLDSAQQQRVIQSLASMSAASRTYKNLHEVAELFGV
jgi:hypothetical protein